MYSKIKEVKNRMYGLLALSVLLASFNSIGLSKVNLGKNNRIFNLNLITALIWCILLFFVSGCSPIINSKTIIWGCAYGLVQSMFILFKALSLRNGPVSITTLIGNSSMLLSIMVSMLLWQESITTAQILGVLVLILSIILCTYKKSSADYTAKWKYYAILFFIFAGCVGIIFKSFSKNVNPEFTNGMMFVSAIVMTVCYTMFCLCTKSLKPFLNPQNKASFAVYAVLTAILSCLYNRLNIFLSGNLQSIIFFPGFNGGVLLLSTLLSVFICKEKLISYHSSSNK